ncbi:MAG: MFS transporter [Pseudomonadota bacterium]
MAQGEAPGAAAQATPQHTRFLVLYGLAWAGGAIAYVPFLTLLLPARVSELTGENAVEWLSYIAFVGAIAASIANLGFGWISDVARSRRSLIFSGLVLSSLALVTAAEVDRLGPLLVHIALWQFGLNMMLSPLAAMAGDYVPDRQKGMLGGLMSFAPAIGGLSGALVTLPLLALERETQLIVVAVMVALCVLPALLFGRPIAMPELVEDVSPPLSNTERLARKSRNAVLRMWIARLLVQIAEAALFAFLLLWLRSLDSAIGESETARLFSMVVLIAIPVAMTLGRWADLHDKPILPLAGAALVSAVGLAAMAFSNTLTGGITGYVIFGVAGAVFLALHSAQTLRVLPRARTRGRDLGFFNLTNTVPSLIMPWLTLSLVPVFGFAGLFALLAVMSAMASILLFSVSKSK